MSNTAEPATNIAQTQPDAPGINISKETETDTYLEKIYNKWKKNSDQREHDLIHSEAYILFFRMAFLIIFGLLISASPVSAGAAIIVYLIFSSIPSLLTSHLWFSENIRKVQNKISNKTNYIKDYYKHMILQRPTNQLAGQAVTTTLFVLLAVTCFALIPVSPLIILTLMLIHFCRHWLFIRSPVKTPTEEMFKKTFNLKTVAEEKTPDTSVNVLDANATKKLLTETSVIAEEELLLDLSSDHSDPNDYYPGNDVKIQLYIENQHHNSKAKNGNITAVTISPKSFTVEEKKDAQQEIKEHYTEHRARLKNGPKKLKSFSENIHRAFQDQTESQDTQTQLFESESYIYIIVTCDRQDYKDTCPLIKAALAIKDKQDQITKLKEVNEGLNTHWVNLDKKQIKPEADLLLTWMVKIEDHIKTLQQQQDIKKGLYSKKTDLRNLMLNNTPLVPRPNSEPGVYRQAAVANTDGGKSTIHLGRSAYRFFNEYVAEGDNTQSKTNPTAPAPAC